ncbi:unnamed protein product [Tuber melanosporum]|uniref:(Perigord truffle) hypothetical protein n=1 Tax=Tuber melanosporum (strain Mel28) TaxID=656061 RepID=D5G9A9_TUBMM|nr:uncharacterized protein GSTUM_00003231001 [Tuber melanosporum]CAZ81102.1 unnamed protein product [Tuber melanosporum]
MYQNLADSRVTVALQHPTSCLTKKIPLLLYFPSQYEIKDICSSSVPNQWSLRSQTLVPGFSGAALVIADWRWGPGDIKKDTKEDTRKKPDTFPTYVGGQFIAIDGKLTDLQVEHEITQEPILRSAIRTMKALDGDKRDMREFVKEVDRMLKCGETVGDFKKGVKILL